MDLNKKIIDAVRQEPVIYGNNNSLEERNRVWKKLSSKLNIQEQYLKIYWHSLVQRYQNEDDFKYADQMQFLQRKTATNQQEGNWPEFVITEDDLQDQQQNGEEFEFVELDELEVTKQIKEERDKENKNHYENQTTINQEKQMKNVKNLRTPYISQEKEKTPLNIIIQSVDTLPHSLSSATDEKREIKENTPTKVVNSNSNLESVRNKVDRPLESQTTELKEKSTECEKQKLFLVVESSRHNNEFKKEEPRMEEPKKIEPPPPPSRCEDDIFGELVSAMLKRMDETKKKNVKKEIMNLLLT